MQEMLKDAGLIPGSGRSSGGGYGNPLQYACMENPMDRGVWEATVHRVTKSQTQLKYLRCTHLVDRCFCFFGLSELTNGSDTIKTSWHHFGRNI